MRNRMGLIWGLAWLVCVTSLSAADWAGFRGPFGNGTTPETEAPLTWSPTENVRWKFPLPGPGNSSPIVSQGKVFVTCATARGQHRTLYCLDRTNGKELWARTVDYGQVEPTHGTNPYCGSTPAADGERVLVWHSSAGLYCYDYAGNELWKRDLGEFRHIWGYGSSPVIHGEKVLLNCGPGARTFLIALNKETGETLWQADEPGGASGDEKDSPNGKPVWVGSWSTPVVITVEGQEQVLVSYPQHIKAYDLQSGKVVWWVDGLGDLVYTSPSIGNGVAAAFGGYHGPAVGFKLGGAGDVTESNRLWVQKNRNPQRIGSGVVVGDYLFLVNAQPAAAQCLNLATGEEKWLARLPEGEIWGSPTLVGNRIYVSNPEGKTYVFAADPEKFELLATNNLEEHSNSTPAVSDGEIFLRTFQHVWCISPQK